MVAELAFLREHGDAGERRLSSLALAGLDSWDIQVFPLADVQLDLARRLAATLMDRSLLPEAELNDAFILAEAAVAGVPLVVSSDKHLLEVNPDSLRDACADADLPAVIPASPRLRLRALR